MEKNGKNGWKTKRTQMTIPKLKIDIVSAKFKAVILLIVTIGLLASFWITLTKKNMTDTIPQLNPINTKVIKEFGPFTVNVKTGMFIKNFPVFDVIKNNFTIDSIIWFEFNSDEIPLETVEKFSFDNDAILYKSPPDIKVVENRIFAKFNVIFNVKTSLNFHKFPFEDHKISLVLSNNFVTPSEMYFTTDSNSFQITPDIIPTSWKLKDLNVDSGYLNLDLDKKDKEKRVAAPKTLFTIDIQKNGIRKILIIFIPLFASTYLSLFSFVMNMANVVGKFSLAITALTALIGYRFVIEQMMPQVGYLTTTDILYVLLLIISLICFIFQLLITRLFMLYSEEEKNAPEKVYNKKIFTYKLEKISSVTFLIISMILNISVAVILLF
jgi:hypothetical protein